MYGIWFCYRLIYPNSAKQDKRPPLKEWPFVLFEIESRKAGIYKKTAHNCWILSVKIACRMQDIPRLHRNFREEFIAKLKSPFHCHRIRCIRNVGKVMVTTLMGRTADCCFPCGVFQRLVPPGTGDTVHGNGTVPAPFPLSPEVRRLPAATPQSRSAPSPL